MTDDPRELKTEPVFEGNKPVGHRCNLPSIKEMEDRLWTAACGALNAALASVEAAESYVNELGSLDEATHARIRINDARLKLEAVREVARKHVPTEQNGGGW